MTGLPQRELFDRSRVRMGMVLALLCSLAVGAGFGGLYVAWQSYQRRSDFLPRCARCNYNLHNLPGTSVACPECGGNLWPAHSVVRGDRNARRFWIYAGLALSLGPMAMLIGVLNPWLGNINTIQWVPTSLLVWRAQSADPATVTPALRELTQRLKSNSLLRGWIEDVVKLGLQNQSNHLVEWNPLWGEFIEEAQKAGRLSPEGWQTYLTSGFSFDFLIPPMARGDPGISCELLFTPPRLASNTSLVVNTSWQFMLSNCPVAFANQRPISFTWDQSMTQPKRFRDILELNGAAASLIAGEHELDVALRLEIYDGVSAQIFLARPTALSELKLTKPIRLLAYFDTTPLGRGDDDLGF